MFRRLKRCFALLFVLTLALPTTAQTLIDQVPAEAVMYVGWQGSSDMGPAYEGSNLQGLLKEFGLLDAVPEVMDLIDQLGEEGKLQEDEAQMAAMAAALLSSAWADGGAMYVLPPEAQGPPIPGLCIMWNKGDNDAQLRDAMNMIVAILGEQMPTYTGEMGQTLYLSVGFNPAGKEVTSLATSARFKTAAKNVQGDGAFMLYMDAKQWIGQLDQFAEMMRQQAENGGPENPFGTQWPKVKDATGLGGVDSIALSAGLKDKNWHTQMFLGAPAPRRGVLSLLENEAIEPASLMHIPKTATYVQMFSMQPSRVLDVTMDVAAKLDPQAVTEIQEALKEGSEEVGFDLEMKLIRGMGPIWSVYVDPMIAGNGFASIVIVNELQDPASVNEAMVKLSGKANEFFEKEDDEVKIRFITQKIEGVAVTHLGFPFISPAWAIKDGRLYVSFYPQALEMAMEQSGKNEDSILANEAFQTAFKRFVGGPADLPLKGTLFDNLKPMTGLSFANLPESASEGYGMTMMLMQIATGMSEMLTGEASSMRMPPLGKLMPYVEVAGGMTRVDADGLHIHLVEPFPGATLLSASKGMTAGAGLTAPMSIAILLPALGEARGAAREAQTMAQVRQITFANFAYSADNKDLFADDLSKLVEYVGDSEIFISPRSNREQALPANFENLPAAQKSAELRKASSFVLIPLGAQNQLRNANQAVMLFERPDETEEFEVVVGFADGHVENVPVNELDEMLRKQTGKSSQQLIDQQVNAGP